ncbi:MAG: restriction endonuclease [Thiobacillus sp. GWE1_62_9]|nr:MAG: restriction endonuclease [Thiobacillus sp. GWE1_62_9]
MAQRKHSPYEGVVEIASKLPWWVGVVFAIAAYLGLHGLATYDVTAVAQAGKLGGFVDWNLVQTLAGVGQYLVPFLFLAGAGLSAYGRSRRGASHTTIGPGQGAFNAMSWHQFEALVGEAFRRRGYSVIETGGGGAGGGGDLVLKKAGAIFLVHCKQWRAPRVGVNAVRELNGVMTARGAIGGFALTSGVFTDEAHAFARDVNIELMDGQALRALVRGVRAPARFFRDPLSVMTTGAPFCPVCQTRMVMRKAKNGEHAGTKFWGCPRYPDCRGKRPV